jgi:hypothetical protein
MHGVDENGVEHGQRQGLQRDLWGVGKEEETGNKEQA